MTENGGTKREFALIRLAIGSEEKIEIQEVEYLALKRAREILTRVSGFEEKFLTICESYRDLELYLFEQNLESMLFSRSSNAEIFSIGTRLSAKIISFLSITRLYIDATRGQPLVENDANFKHSDIDQIFRDTYDSSFEYRVMEAIRNYCQHREFPVHAASYNSSWDDNFETHSYSAQFSFNIKSIGNDKKFKGEIREEIAKRGGKVDLIPCIRGYFYKLCETHERIREKFSLLSGKSENVVEHARFLWATKYDGRNIGVAAVALVDDLLDEAHPKIYISSDIEQYRLYLQSRTHSVSNMAARRVAF